MLKSIFRTPPRGAATPIARCCGALMIMAAAAPVAAAIDEPVPPSRVVHIGDLDLARPAHRAVLARRIHRAAADVCWVDGTPLAAAMFTGPACIRDTVAVAMRQVARVTAANRSASQTAE